MAKLCDLPTELLLHIASYLDTIGPGKHTAGEIDWDTAAHDIKLNRAKKAAIKLTSLLCLLDEKPQICDCIKQIFSDPLELAKYDDLLRFKLEKTDGLRRSTLEKTNNLPMTKRASTVRSGEHLVFMTVDLLCRLRQVTHVTLSVGGGIFRQFSLLLNPKYRGLPSGMHLHPSAIWGTEPRAKGWSGCVTGVNGTASSPALRNRPPWASRNILPNLSSFTIEHSKEADNDDSCLDNLDLRTLHEMSLKSKEFALQEIDLSLEIYPNLDYSWNHVTSLRLKDTFSSRRCLVELLSHMPNLTKLTFLGRKMRMIQNRPFPMNPIDVLEVIKETRISLTTACLDCAYTCWASPSFNMYKQFQKLENIWLNARSSAYAGLNKEAIMMLPQSLKKIHLTGDVEALHVSLRLLANRYKEGTLPKLREIAVGCWCDDCVETRRAFRLAGVESVKRGVSTPNNWLLT
ncbi:glycylpeptide N-tetradecanoyltransferase [Colletotrichum asianum]|uniref:Glycylpeptide N-tetradecanoyltransferase n=1 Tax=Colletotrichum asianum TaxID=702518 RepID=A0A8H3ZK20_9PEZI|nr:glycylpeptide N-tetradecanoyltransferase [Colletotrichum asianum]